MRAALRLRLAGGREQTGGGGGGGGGRQPHDRRRGRSLPSASVVAAGRTKARSLAANRCRPDGQRRKLKRRRRRRHRGDFLLSLITTSEGKNNRPAADVQWADLNRTIISREPNEPPGPWPVDTSELDHNRNLNRTLSQAIINRKSC